MIAQRVAVRIALGAILLIALGWRLHNIGFGLPSMYDPDEPIFMITALRMLAEGTLNPGWFGHPGSTTIYLVAAIDAAVASIGLASGRYNDLAEFSRAAYADPALLFVPARVAMALIGTLCVALTYALGRRLHGPAVGLVAAGLLAINSLHIAWSQVVRTDINASVFMLACMMFAVRTVEHRALRDLLIAAAFAGLATATKWPAATVFIAVIGAFVLANLKQRLPKWWLVAAGAVALAAVFLASPYIFLDWPTVLANVSGEVKSGHLAHNGGSFLDNLLYYLGDSGRWLHGSRRPCPRPRRPRLFCGSKPGRTLDDAPRHAHVHRSDLHPEFDLVALGAAGAADAVYRRWARDRRHRPPASTAPCWRTATPSNRPVDRGHCGPADAGRLRPGDRARQ